VRRQDPETWKAIPLKGRPTSGRTRGKCILILAILSSWYYPNCYKLGYWLFDQKVSKHVSSISEALFQR
jgi:hypothetical protein